MVHLHVQYGFQGLELVSRLTNNFFKTADWKFKALPGSAVQGRHKFFTAAADSQAVNNYISQMNDSRGNRLLSLRRIMMV